ncbi:DUF6887 family protein [Coleofasciculus sp.]|uniref:DUF6887 family protein n=1 Tax=Coleofasciculus sp. TaxID=3100458 RepID=UPI003A2DB5F1
MLECAYHTKHRLHRTVKSPLQLREHQKSADSFGEHVTELRAYVLEHRDDMEAIRALFHHPSLKWTTMPPLVTGDD